MKKKPNKLTARKKLDTVTSLLVRQTYADKDGNVKCYTCPKVAHWKQMQCGHFTPRQYLACRYDLRNLRVQCYACNFLYNGQPATFAKNLEAETPGIVNELEKLRWVVTKDFPYDELLVEYEEKLKSLGL